MKMKRLACVSLLMMAMGSGAAFAQTADGLSPFVQIRAYAGWIKQSPAVTGVEKEADTDFVEQFGTTRFGAKGKYGEFDGYMELGISSSNSSSSNGVSLRKAYAVWNLSDVANLKVGQDEAPYTFYANSVTMDCSFNGMGVTSQPRDMHVKFTYMGAYVDFLSPIAPPAITYDATAKKSTGATNWDLLAPKTAIGYDFTSADKTVSAGVSAVYQYSVFDGQKNVAGSTLDALDDKRVDAGLAAAHVLLNLAPFSVKADFGYGINTAVLGIDYTKSFAKTTTSVGTAAVGISTAPELNKSANGFKNTASMEGFLELAYKMSFAEFRTAVSYVDAKNDNWKKHDQQMGYYLQATIPLVEKRFNLIPEICYFDFMDDKAGNNQGYELCGGMLFQVLLM